ncbi:anterior gradient protein 2-like [Scleropages formosus]|uniref:Anterior gradient protein 2-like n=1 Tax=Scleropages formosus TaxID=113540 RepID=A0A0P7UPD7_SCLFO|nr:anterior gradient protein 2-like [Scleropages formosus]
MPGLLSAPVLLAAVSSSLGKPETRTAPKPERVPQTLSRGWGDELIWAQTYEEALYRAKSSTKPLMVIFHLENCPHSSALKKAFAENKKIQKMADEDFILLNLVFEITDKHLSSDGQYIPRILFVGKWPGALRARTPRAVASAPRSELASPSLRLADPSLTVRADITGRYADRLYAYEPSDVGLPISNMKKAKKLLKTEL